MVGHKDKIQRKQTLSGDNTIVALDMICVWLETIRAQLGEQLSEKGSVKQTNSIQDSRIG